MHRRHLLILVSLALSTLNACGKKSGPKSPALPANARVLALGDSLTEGTGASPAQAWPVQLAQLTGWQIDNQGVRGDTSEDALERLPALLARERYDAILIGIGGNDMLRQLNPQATQANITRIVRAAREHTSHVALLATPAPNAMRAATGTLKDAPFYADLARAEGVLLLDNIYASVLSDASLRSDQVHANAKGYAEIARLLEGKLKAAGWKK